MADIVHRVGIRASADKTFNALTTLDGLASWWTRETRGDATPGGVIHFQFGDKGFFDMQVLSSEASTGLVWQVQDGPPEWVGTTVHWNLKPEGDMIVVLFRHQGWREVGEFMHHCSTKWAIFLMSLKALLEDGAGLPAPDDVKIDNWN